MNKTDYFLKDQFTWFINKDLLLLILDDKVSDSFVCELIWERLFYVKKSSMKIWSSSEKTPEYWSDKFTEAPEIIAERSASVHLTRSIPKDFKQGLKKNLNFKGYKINELYPRRTRRATAVNWLLYWAIETKCNINDPSLLPKLSVPSSDPSKGHHGDPDIK